MLHDEYVGHFDPRDPADLTVRPHRPKVQRSMERQALERALATFTSDVAGFVEWDEKGFAICHWTAPGAERQRPNPVREFARALADAEGAIVMTHMFQVVYPDLAREMQERFFAGAARGTWLHRRLRRAPGTLPQWLLSSTARGPKNDVLTWAPFFVAALLTAAVVIIGSEFGLFSRPGPGYLIGAVGPAAFAIAIVFEIAAIEPCRKVERVARAIARRGRSAAGDREA